MEKFINTAGGKIVCLRCQAKSSRSKIQCSKPALKKSPTQKCQFHGGGGHTADALKNIAAAKVTHGQTTKEAKRQYGRDTAFLRELEDALHLLGAVQGPKTRGRKPSGYRPVRTQADLIRLFKERQLHCV